MTQPNYWHELISFVLEGRSTLRMQFSIFKAVWRMKKSKKVHIANIKANNKISRTEQKNKFCLICFFLHFDLAFLQFVSQCVSFGFLCLFDFRSVVCFLLEVTSARLLWDTKQYRWPCLLRDFSANFKGLFLRRAPHHPSYEWRTKLLANRNGHGQSGWSPISCEGSYRNLNIPCPLLTALVFC